MWRNVSKVLIKMVLTCHQILRRHADFKFSYHCLSSSSLKFNRFLRVQVKATYLKLHAG